VELQDGSRIAVIGGGPSGSLVSYFLLDLAERAGLQIQIDIYETKDFSAPGPAGCNMCGGVISESLVQLLATEGINLPDTVVRRGIDSYVLHSDVGTVRLETPHHEMRIASVHRGGGPRGAQSIVNGSFDGFLLDLACKKGANLIRARVEALAWENGRLRVGLKDGSAQTYDLLVGAVGVNTSTLALFETLGFRYRPPKTAKTFIAEFYLGAEAIKEYLGNSMHVFLIRFPGIDFAALIPKGDYVTLCLLGRKIDREAVDRFLDLPQVRSCFPPDWTHSKNACQCSPKINVQEAKNPFCDRIVLIGDSGASRLYKDGIGAAYRAAKAASVTAVFEGISALDFRKFYLPAYRGAAMDNFFGKLIFFVVGLIRRLRFLQRGVLRLVGKEQKEENTKRRMSMVLWDSFTGSAPYREVFLRTLHPAFLGSFLVEIIKALLDFWAPRSHYGR
jgi:flavin-dependent dehydrogenase